VKEVGECVEGSMNKDDPFEVYNKTKERREKKFEIQALTAG
jgi:hypothetical protein